MPQISENEPNYSAKVSKRAIELIEQNKLEYTHELQLIEVLFKKFELVTIQDYADKIGKTYNGIQDKIKRNKLATIEISGKVFVLSRLN